MNNAIPLLTVTVIITALSGLIFYAHRAGRYAAQIFEAKEQKNKAQENNRIMQQMAQAETHKPATRSDLLKTLDNGEA